MTASHGAKLLLAFAMPLVAIGAARYPASGQQAGSRKQQNRNSQRSGVTMTRTRIFALLSIALAALAPRPTTAVAQVGGLIKKAKEAVKPPKKEEPAAAAPMKDIYADPSVVPITIDQLVRFEKALKYEVSERTAILNEKPPAKTDAEFQACSGNTAMSPQAQKIAAGWAKANENATPEQLVKSSEKMQADMVALVVKLCGEDPSTWQSKHDERLREIPGKASDIAMPDGWLPRKSGDDGPAGHSGSWGPWVGDNNDEAWFEAAQQPHPFLRAYAVLKERLVPFCVAVDAGMIVVNAGTVGSGVGFKAPEVGGAGIYIYTNAEARDAAPKCPSLMTWLKQLR
jgi:hypothetical protein